MYLAPARRYLTVLLSAAGDVSMHVRACARAVCRFCCPGEDTGYDGDDPGCAIMRPMPVRSGGGPSVDGFEWV
jgi:hypothetical protein